MLLVLIALAGAAVSNPLRAEDALDPRTTPAAFQRQFVRAFSGGVLNDALALFYWSGVPAMTRQGVELLVQRDLAATLIRSGWLPPEPTREFWSGNVRMRSNLMVVARFAAEFETEGGTRHLSMHEVGVVDGVLYIGLAEPVPGGQSVRWDGASGRAVGTSGERSATP